MPAKLAALDTSPFGRGIETRPPAAHQALLAPDHYIGSSSASILRPIRPLFHHDVKLKNRTL